MEETWSWGEGKFVAGEVHVRVRYAHMSYQCVAPAEGLFFRVQMAPNLLLPVVVDRVFMPRQIVKTQFYRTLYGIRKI